MTHDGTLNGFLMYCQKHLGDCVRLVDLATEQMKGCSRHGMSLVGDFDGFCQSCFGVVQGRKTLR